MTESAAIPGSDDNADPAGAALPLQTSYVVSLDAAAHSLVTGTPEPIDDAPTVISKPQPKPAPTDGDFVGTLRGQRLAHYELLEPLGVGGMAAVLRARDTQLDRDVALKILPPDMAADSENVRRFHQEARSAAKLDHENIARVFFCGEDQTLHFIAFEYVEGENLRTLIERRGRLPAREALPYMIQIAAGLVHAAERGVVHRDIKPSNIVITPSGKSKLVDMGLARSLERHENDGLTQSGVTLGTFDYISPEQALEPRDADARSDIYSLGCTFYHAVTGQAPVPEGTAARKLQHHQHVKPIDPRELAPDIPDAVAVVLDRMMAKRPEERYQSPAQLMQQLVHAARVVGVGSDVVEGLSLPAPPAPPPMRPYTLVGLGVIAVVLLVFFADLGGGTSHRKNIVAVRKDSNGTAGEVAAESKAKERLQPLLKPEIPNAASSASQSTTARYDAEPPTLAGLLAWLAEPATRRADSLEIVLAGDLAVSIAEDGSDPHLLIRGKKVTIRPKKVGQRPTITLSHRGQTQKDGDIWTALTVVGDEVLIEGLRLVLKAQQADYAMAGLRLQGRRQVVRDCEFVQLMPAFDRFKRLTSILAEGRTGGASLSLQECCWLGFQNADLISRSGYERQEAETYSGADPGGQDAVTRRGAVALSAENCVWGPHAAAFRLEGGELLGDHRVKSRHCSFLEGADSVAFDIAENAAADLVVEASLFSRAGEAGMGMGSVAHPAVLLRKATSALVAFHGVDNRYHNLDSYLALGDSRDTTDIVGFSSWLGRTNGSDVRSLAITDSPWQSEQPLKMLEATRPVLAFRPNARLPELRLPLDGRRETLVGATRVSDEDFIALLQAPKPTVAVAPPAGSTRTVDPLAKKDDPLARIYARLDRAIRAARPGDVIVLKANGRVVVSPIVLGDATNLTLKPARGYRPELVLGETAGSEIALFDMLGGQLRIEDLAFRVQPGDDTKSACVVSLSAMASCTLVGCTVTLEPARSRPVSIALASLSDAMLSRESLPRIRLEGCFLRGVGDVVRAGNGQPFDLTVENTLAVLMGSFINLKSSTDSFTEGRSITASLRQVTACLGENLIWLQADKDVRGLPPVRCDATRCLFVVGEERSLIHLDGPETSEEKLKQRLTWKGDSNAYGLPLKDRMFDQLTPGDEMAMPGPMFGAERWKSIFNESVNSQYGVIRFQKQPADESSFVRATTADLETLNFKDFGVAASTLPGGNRPAQIP